MKTTDTIEVAIGSGDSPVVAGTLRPSFHGGRALASSSFEYAPRYLDSRSPVPLSPDLPLVEAAHSRPQTRRYSGSSRTPLLTSGVKRSSTPIRPTSERRTPSCQESWVSSTI